MTPSGGSEVVTADAMGLERELGSAPWEPHEVRDLGFQRLGFTLDSKSRG